MNGRAFDAQVVLTPESSHRGQLLSRYVRARITAMDGIDIGLFDFDRHNAIYYFILNAEEDIYLRYGGRDERAADSYLNLRSLELALQQGLEIHEAYLVGDRPPRERPDPLYPRDVALLREHTNSGRCVECHLIADYQLQQKEKEGTLDKLTDMFRAPDIKSIGITLDIPKGLVVLNSNGPAGAAGIAAGDTIVALDDSQVLTFGDFQHRFAQVSRHATVMRLAVKREDRLIEAAVKLPPRWWKTDLEYRYWSVDPQVFFSARPLSAEQKADLKLNPNGFASVVTAIDPAVRLLKKHQLQVGDVVYAVNGIETDEVADTCVLHIKLRCGAGERVMLSVIRDGQQLELPLRTDRQSFRK